MRTPGFFALALGVLSACGDGQTGAGTGRVQIFVVPEDSIPEGLTPGTGEENVVDGWRVEYSKFLVAIGGFRAGQSAHPAAALSAPRVWIVDLLRVPSAGLVLADLEAEAGRWDRFGFDLPNATPAAERAEGTAEADHERMVQGGLSLYVAGTLTRPDGQSCLPTRPADCKPAPRITFAWGLRVGTSFDDCAPAAGDAGFAVPPHGAVQVKPTLHGDHWFFSNITQGAEITRRRAQWIANADLDRDGETTLAELRMTRAADLFSAEDYNLSGALFPIFTAEDYLEAQARSLGDYQGDGECPTRRLLP